MARKADNTESGTFDQLAGDLSRKERKDMLDRMGDGQSAATGEDTELFAAKTKVPDARASERAEFSLKLKQESVFTKVFLWIKSILTSSSMEDVFNASLVRGIARDVENQFPSLIVYRRKAFYNIFYEKLLELKKVADFFRPYLVLYEDKPGAFYVILGHVLMPEFEKQFAEQVDPFQYSFDLPLSTEIKNDLLQTVGARLKEIPADYQREMYRCAKSVFWLDQFTKLPFAKMLSRFSLSEENVRECAFSPLRADFGKFAEVIDNYVPVDSGVIEAFICSMGVNGAYEWFREEDEGAQDGDYADFRDAVRMHLGMLDMFIKTVPVEKLAKIVFEDALYTLPELSGGENWQDLFSERWKHLFKKRMALWESNFAKEKLRVKLDAYFHFKAFPLFPFRPWENVWNGIHFQRELTLGLINFFMKQRYVAYTAIFKAIATEGQFAIKDNQREFTEAIDNFNEVNNDLDVLANQLSQAGEYGSEFSKYEGKKERTEAAASKINWIMVELESDAAEISRSFRRMGHRMINLLSGFISDKYTGRYGAVINLRDMQRRLGDFYSMVKDAKVSFEHIYEVVQELDELEDPKRPAK